MLRITMKENWQNMPNETSRHPHANRLLRIQASQCMFSRILNASLLGHG